MAVDLTRMIENGFKKWCMSNALHWTDGDVLWNGREEDGKSRSYYEENEGY